MCSQRNRVLASVPTLLLLAATAASAQPNLTGAEEVRLALARLNVLGSVLMIGAHPDDEQTPTLAYMTRGRSIRAAYLSVTRGEGGQNLLGPEQGDLLGLIRTEELLAARRIDGAEQFFTRAIDFGFTKTAQETFDKWGHEAILGDVVWVIRRYRPDVIVLCFSGTSRDGHGQHQVSSILGKEAFTAAADKTRFPEQLKWVEPWQAKRVVWGVYGRAEMPRQISIETGDYNPGLGYSYIEIAGISRGMHHSQGTGNLLRRGAATANLVPMAGEPATKDLFDGIDTTWNRVPGGVEAGRILAEAARSLDTAQPEKVVPLLLEARKRMAALKGPWVALKRAELDDAVALCAGLWLDASADRWAVVPGSAVTVRTTALNRSRLPIRLTAISLAETAPLDVELPYNQPSTREFTWKVPADAAYSQPYWLVEPRPGDVYTVPDQQLVGTPENPPVLRARFRLRINSEELELTRPVLHRYADRVRGELTRPVAIVPPVALQFSEPVSMFPNQQPKKVEVVLKSNIAAAAGEVSVQAPDGWRVEPASRKFQLAETGDETTLAFEVAPPAAASRTRLVAVASLGERRISSGMQVIAYSHIQPQTVFPPSAADAVGADIRILAKRIGYVMGAGDEVPQALRQLGCDVTLLSAGDLAGEDLAPFDAIVTGVRAYNTRPDLRANQHRLLDYVNNGGTLVVQYNVPEFGAAAQALDRIGPYPMRITRDRVTVEEAPVTFPTPDSPLLQQPNRITAADFEGWVQERGLYFATDWDSHYRPLLESHDPGETPKPGGTLYVRYGKGAYVFTGYSWFRQLPAGVPGAFRVFANLLSAGKVLQ